MQFITNGPDIPDTLLQAHEDGRVVFFCGAGISSAAGLPGFKGLVDEIYKRAGTSRDDLEQEAYGRGQFDATLDLLERRLPGQRIAVRQQLANALSPKWRRRGATDTHAALLELARCREGSIRLVTTNFDRIFERAGKRIKKPFRTYAAPTLPIPKNSRWNGLVYLHGLLPEKPDDSALHRLVITSGDFGLAYLTERWAARFVSELFRNYVVCFIGYSINDPVMRYMMDALAADRMQGEITPQAYALGDCEPGQEQAKTLEWEAKGVTPILYEVTAGDHSVLHKTVKAWAETYRDGVLGKERIIVDYAMTRPSASTRQDDFVGRVLWALSHESGLPTARFADFNPVPSLDWLEAFSDPRYLHRDLPRFDINPNTEVDKKLRFSLIRRPTPYHRASWMTLTSDGGIGSQWDDVMFHLARWLLRHLNDPTLIMWLVQSSWQLNERFAQLVARRLDELSRLMREGKTTELDEIRAHAANAIPGSLMTALWRLLLIGRIKSSWNNLDVYHCIDSLKREGVTATRRLELRELLSPKILLKQPLHWNTEETEADEPDRVRQLVDWELVLAADHVSSSLREISDECWQEMLPLLLDDIQQLLRDALDLLRELGSANDYIDRSHWDLPSISEHWQNRGFRDWVILIELLRDAWSTTAKHDAERARQIALEWFAIPYPTFKRLALFSASRDNSIEAAQWVNWLTADGARWLWSPETRRETMRLLVLQGAQLTLEARFRLESAILSGPPREMFREDLEQDDWQRVKGRSIWLHLAKLRQGGELSESALNRLKELSAENPRWELASNEQDEFSHWMSGTGDPDYESNRNVDIAPRTRTDLVQWLKQPQPDPLPFMYEDTWRDVCRTRFFHSFMALCDLAQQNIWPSERWGEALRAWSEESLAFRSWRYAGPLVQRMPDHLIQDNANSISWWIETASKFADRHEDILLDLCRRLLAVSRTSGTNADQSEPDVENHLARQVTQALLNLWFKKKPSDNDSLPESIEPFFRQICDVTNESLRSGRALLASRSITLFRIDRPWTEKFLLPLFDWSWNAVEAKGAWRGFLLSPRLHNPFLIAVKSQYLSTAEHYADLGEYGRQFAAFLTYAALARLEGYEPQDFQSAISKLPKEGLQEAARALWQALESAGEQREDYWRHRVQPFWQLVWPKSRNLASSNIAESLTRLSIAARGEFPSALAAVEGWLQPFEQPHYVVHLLNKSGLCKRFPEEALRLLDHIVNGQRWAPRELKQCLESITHTMPALIQDHRHKRLDVYARQHAN